MSGTFMILKVLAIVGVVVILNSCSVNRSQSGEKKEIHIDREVVETITYEMGVLYNDDRKELTLKLKNLLQVPLIINDIQGFCSCTIPYYEKEPILPGQTSEVSISFIPHHTGMFNKELKMYLSSQAKPIQIIFKGEIVKN